MKNTLKITFVLFIGLFVSCSNDDDTTVDTQNEESNFFALTIGNSWTYKAFKQNSNDTDYALIDYSITTSITGTEEINGETFYVFESTSQGQDSCTACDTVLGAKKARDLDGTLINEDGITLYTNQTEEPYLIQSSESGTLMGQFEPQTETFETPEGVFSNVELNQIFFVDSSDEISIGREHKVYSNAEEGLLVRTITLASSSTPLYYLILEQSTIIE